jgi:indole-3-glycerol phosphate synthase
MSCVASISSIAMYSWVASPEAGVLRSTIFSGCSVASACDRNGACYYSYKTDLVFFSSNFNIVVMLEAQVHLWMMQLRFSKHLTGP